jgi:hypothetical protein
LKLALYQKLSSAMLGIWGRAYELLVPFYFFMHSHLFTCPNHYKSHSINARVFFPIIAKYGARLFESSFVLESRRAPDLPG